jgi:hypothetical protein
MRKFLLILLICLFSSQVFSEQFRVGQIHSVDLQVQPDFKASKKVKIIDAIAIKLPEDKTFIDAVEIKMEIPESIASWRDSVACSLYEKITPEPTESQIDYFGNRTTLQILPGKLSWILQIPLTKNNELKSDQYVTRIQKIPDVSNGFLFVRLHPIMKGMPDEVFEKNIKVTITPVLKNKGLLNLSILSPDEKLQNCSLFIDEKPYDLVEGSAKIILETGLHNLSVISDFYRSEVRTVRVEQAKKTDLVVELKSLEPTLIVTAPDGVKVYLDEEEFLDVNKEVKIMEGEHKVRFSVGEYDLTRTLNVIKGKTYKADFTLDLQITEEN